MGVRVQTSALRGVALFYSRFQDRFFCRVMGIRIFLTSFYLHRVLRVTTRRALSQVERKVRNVSRAVSRSLLVGSLSVRRLSGVKLRLIAVTPIVRVFPSVVRRLRGFSINATVL